MTNRVNVCPHALNKLKRQELLNLCTLHTPNMFLEEEIYLKRIKRVMPALNKMDRQGLLYLCTLDTPDVSPVEKDMLNRLTVPGLLNYTSSSWTRSSAG